MFDWYLGLITYIVCCHILSNTYTIYIHRGLGHHYFEFGKFLDHVFRFITWFFLGFRWNNWMQHYAAIHRKHHEFSDTIDDPHSPHFYTFKEMIDVHHNDPSKANYVSAEEILLYAPDIKTTNDWIEVNLYIKYPNLGKIIFIFCMTLLFGITGLLIGLFNYFFMPIVYIFGGNYATHKIGFTYPWNTKKDLSKIVMPWGLLAGGEEIHAHHHDDPSLPYFSRHWWEFDPGWFYSKIFMFFGLMRRIK